MLGEDHSLLKEFPKHKDAILRLMKTDANFAKQTNRYNELDKNIRQLELDGTPISDEAMRSKKHDRAVLKDALFLRLTESENA